MSALFAIALAAATAPIDCSWDNPGANPYSGTAEAAIDRYQDLPEKVRTRLKYRLQYGNPDEVALIRRDAIEGKHGYGAAIRDMHFGKARLCATVSRARWSASRSEPGAVYCIDGHCVLVPQICGNVSRITRFDADKPAALSARNLETITVFDWTDHVGTYELGLFDAPPQEFAEHSGTLRGMPGLPLATVAPGAEYAMGAPPKPRQLGGIRGPAGKTPVTAVPETATWAMLLAGLGMLGFMARRRR